MWVTLAVVREPLEIESWNFTCGLTMLMKGPFDSFSLHLELQSCIPFLKLCFNFPIVMLILGVQ